MRLDGQLRWRMLMAHSLLTARNGHFPRYDSQVSAQQLLGLARAYWITGLLASAGPEELLRISPDSSEKNLRCPVVPTWSGTAVMV